MSGEHEYKVGSGRPAWDLIGNWIDNCAQNHVKCNQTSQKERWYPTRLLDLRNATELRVKLIDTTETPPDGPYVSLSHRWHSTSVKKTTQDTLTAFMNGIDVSSLPKTFQDAITVSRNLNVRFLWIDSLCIIQETNDWERESSLMGHIYANAMCNLSALGATAENGGLFFPRDAESIRPLKLDIACKDGPYDLVHQGFWKSAVDDMDLNLRGWVFQERLLAPRALHFGSEQLFWECRELNACESYPEGLREEIWTRPWKRDYTDTGLSHMPSRKLMMIWHELIEQYTRCSLTMGEDKLVAISGIAKIVQQKLEDDYLAGLWRRNLLEDLLWEVSRDEVRAQRPDRYRAPSWSWASVDGRISCQSSWPGGHDRITVLNAEVSLQSVDLTGQVKAGEICLRGNLYLCEGRFFTTHGNFCTVIDKPTVTVQLDVAPASPIGIETLVHFLPVTLHENFKQHQRGLCLESTQVRQGVYKRIGTFQSWNTGEELLQSTTETEEERRKLYLEEEDGVLIII